MTLTLIYRMVATLLSWMALLARSDSAKDVEILVLRYQLAVLTTPHTPASDELDRPSHHRRPHTAAPSRRRLRLLVTPATILRWHPQLAASRWTSQHTHPGRPAIPAGVRALIVRLATENPTWGYVDVPAAPAAGGA